MEERFLQQLKKGVLELLVLQTICRGPTYGYELIAQLKSALVTPDDLEEASDPAGCLRSGRERSTRFYTGWRTTD